jgi:pyrimidine deaminase RibD-like protein
MSNEAAMTAYHTSFMRQALSEARKAEPSLTAFSVGCLLVAWYPKDDSLPFQLSRGHSRELPGNTHAEANALSKLMDVNSPTWERIKAAYPTITPEALLQYTTVYTTVEPCSVRLSGLQACADKLIAARVKRCVIGAAEPPDFVKCEGAQKMKAAGIEVIWFDKFQEECIAIARNGIPKA